MELINPNSVVNNSINNDYYCENIIKELRESQSKLLNGFVFYRDNRIDYDCQSIKVSVEIDKSKPINMDSLREVACKSIDIEFGGFLRLEDMGVDGLYEPRIIFIIRVLDPYKTLYTFYPDEFRNKILGLLNEEIEKTAKETNSKLLKLTLVRPSCCADEPLAYLVKAFDDIFKDSAVYKTRLTSDKDEYNKTLTIYWGEGELEEEPIREREAQKAQEEAEKELPPWMDREEPKKLSYMDRIREYAKRLVSYERNQV